MADQASRELQRKVEDVIDRFSQQSLSVQKKAIQCSLSCFDRHAGYKEVGQCVQQCQKPFEGLSQVTQRELGGLQSGVQHCMQQCYNQVAPLMQNVDAGAAMPSAAEQQAAQSKMDGCSMQCIKNAMSQVDDVESRLLQHVKNMS
eukprot:GEMP01108681.1.p1 GENE.GEMP01108681.1~~GEMP01108681.1.p1  ORF type:complete len:145 (+),score=31.02 GEMP01108681.1:138-572(+)